MNKSVIVVIIAIVIIAGISIGSFALQDEIDYSQISIETSEEPIGKNYKASLSENLGISGP